MQKPEFNSNQIHGIVRSVLTSEARAVAEMAQQLPENIARAVQLLFACEGRVIVTGMGKMSAIARKCAATLCSVGTPAVFLHPSEALHGDLGIVSDQDVLLALSNSGETRDVLELVPFMKRHQVPIISISGNSKNALAEVSDLNLATGVSSEADQITAAPTNSTTATLALTDGLAMALVHLRGFTAEQFAVFHPSGKIGRQLLMRVGDLMQVDDMPVVTQESTVRESIVAISKGKLGAGFIVDQDVKLIGIVTDGDLRRILETQANPLDQPVTSVMNRQPKVLDRDQLAVDALNHMNAASITVMPVVDEDRSILGALHLHVLLKSGIG